VDSGDLYDKLMEMTESTEGPRQGEMLDWGLDSLLDNWMSLIGGCQVSEDY
jgi:hypothetical protein